MEQKKIDKKTEKEKIDSVQNTYAQFADCIKQWNRLHKVGGVILGILGVAGCAAVAILETLAVGLGSTVAMLFAFLFGMMVSWIHCEMYVRVDGKGNHLNQYIHGIPLLMAFSIKDYYKEIERRLWKKIKVISGIVFVIIFVISGVHLFKNVFRVVALCAMTVAIMDVTIVISFLVLRYFDIRSFKSCIEKGKSRKLISSKEVSFWSKYPIFYILLYVVSVIGAVGLIGIRNYILRVPDDIEVYRSVSDGLLAIYMIIVCVICGGEQIGRLVTKKGGSVKQVTCLGVLIVVAVLYVGTIYTTYYEDKIVVNRFFQEKEYAWEEVQSYTVKSKWMSGVLQLELEMKDKTLWVISSEYIASEKHYNNYFYEYEYEYEYEYIAHLVEKMDTYGIQGYMEDEEEITPHPDFFNPESVQAFERIKAAVYGS